MHRTQNQPRHRGPIRIVVLGLTVAAAIAVGSAHRPAEAVDAVAGGTTVTRYGAAVSLGRGTARAYATVEDGVPREIGVALTAGALVDLPTAGSGHHGGHAMTHEYLLDLPEEHATPFTFLEMNWNPSGHEPEGVYQDVPHFDFHFWTAGKAEREAIDPAAPDWAEKADRLPAPELVPAHNAILAPPGAPASAVAVPKMGVHWVDVRSHELQGLFGNPDGYRPFTTTFIHGSWDGRLVFWEPMITLAHLLEKRGTSDPAVRDEILEIPLPEAYGTPGWYPEAYRIRWVPEAQEYRVALTRLTPRG